MGWSSELYACTSRSSVDCTSIGGGLAQSVVSTTHATITTTVHLRPGAVDANDATLGEAVGVGVLDVGDVPPDLVYPREDGGRGGGEQGKCRPHLLVSSVPV